MGGYIVAFVVGVIVGEIAIVIASCFTNANKVNEDEDKNE